MFRDKDQDREAGFNVAQRLRGGWWYGTRHNVNVAPTGRHTKTRHTGYGDNEYIQYGFGGRQGKVGYWDNWAEAEFVLVPN